MARPKHQHLHRAVGYLRTSTSQQDLSPEAQRHAIEQWAARNGVSVVAWAEDVGVSGTTPPPGRDGFVDALAHMDRYRAGTLAVARLDRLSRSSMDYAVVAHDLELRRRRLVTADGVGNSGNAEARLIRSVLAAAAAYEVEMIRARTRAALRAKRRRGERTSGIAPYGFGFDPANPKRLVPNHIERAALRRAGELRRQGLAYRDVAATLNAEGRPHRGNGWSDRNVGRLLREHPEGFLRSPADG